MELPSRISKYELQECLGGGMSRVYKARDTLLGRTVVVKILTDEACRDAEAKARFLQEARVAGNIFHDNIIRIYDFGEEQGRPYMVMEFLHGEDLRTLIKSERTGDLASRLRIALQIARALEHIHAQKIIHRDIKPDNIHMTTQGVIKLMDFGIAKAADTALTRPGFTLGTPYYMAPEQVRGLPVTPLVDIYAFGVLLFELLTGVKPIEGDTIERIFYMILYQPLDLTPLDTAGVPAPIKDLVSRCTSKEPAQRPQSFTALVGELEQRIREQSGEPRPAPPPAAATEKTLAAAAPAPARVPTPPAFEAPAPPPQSNRSTIALALAGLLMLAAATYLYFRPQTPVVRLAAILPTPTGEMVLVRAGEFRSGADRRAVTLPAFYIDRTEVSNAVYATYCEARKRPLPEHFRKSHPDFPITNITYMDAQEFARWAGKRLPTPLEWEKAARGADGRLYPWGNQTEPRRANVKDNPDRKEGDLMPVDSFADGASPYGALNMAGNAWEFVDELRTPGPEALRAFSKLLKPAPTATEPWYAIRGGAYDIPLSYRQLWETASEVPARFRDFDLGFRCVKDPK